VGLLLHDIDRVFKKSDRWSISGTLKLEDTERVAEKGDSS